MPHHGADAAKLGDFDRKKSYSGVAYDGSWILIRNKYLQLLIIAGLVVLLDQITKALVLEQIPLYSTLEVIPGFFNLTHIQNPGGAFGFLAGAGPGVRQLVFTGFSLVAIAVIFYLYVSTPPQQRELAVGLALIFGGAVGNMVDRLRFGQVVDFLQFYVKAWYWPSFNVADSAITIGIGFFIWQLVFHKSNFI